jgi:hypothetical protein
MEYDAVIALSKNEWNGRASVQAMIHDIKVNYRSSSYSDLLDSMNDKFMLSYSQGFYSDENAYPIKTDYDFLTKMLSESSFSTLVLSMDKASTYKLMEIAEVHFDDLEIRVSEIEPEKLNYNTLVIAPDIERINFNGYDNVFIISEFDASNMYNSLHTNGKVYIIGDYIKTENTCSLELSRLRELYVEIKKSILDGRAAGFIRGEGTAKLWEARMSLRIFKEADLIEYSLAENKFMLTDKKKTDIMQSGTYKRLQAGE